MDRVRELLKTAPAVHADETQARDAAAAARLAGRVSLNTAAIDDLVTRYQALAAAERSAGWR